MDMRRAVVDATFSRTRGNVRLCSASFSRVTGVVRRPVKSMRRNSGQISNLSPLAKGSRGAERAWLMIKLRILALVPLAASLLAVPHPFSTPAGAEQMVGRSVTLAGRKMSCGKADIMVDHSLPSEGGAGETILILNPTMLNQQPPTVRLFVFTHECGHLSVGDSELKADCFAVNRGVREGWLTRQGLREVCDSFEGAPETPTHPSAKRRCANLDRCFAKAEAEKTPVAPRPIPVKMPPETTATITAAIPELPIRKSAALAGAKVVSAWRCTDPVEINKGAKDPIGNLIAKHDDRVERCQ